MGGDVEEVSLIQQMSTIVDGVVDEGRVKAATEKLLSHYPRTRVPGVVKAMLGGDEDDIVSRVEKIFEQLNPLASPGFPLLKLGPTKRAVLENHKLFVLDLVLARLAAYLSEDVSDDPLVNVERNLVDPVAVFVKMEPHKKEKLQGRERLIASVSMIDEIVARLLFSKQNSKEIDNWEDVPSKPGMGLHDEGLAMLSEEIRDMAAWGPIADSDVSGWDWNVKWWQLEADIDRRARLLVGTGEEVALFRRLGLAHHRLLARSLYVLSNGKVYAQLFWGVMKSGSYVTSSTNSFMRSHLAVYVGSDPDLVIAMGDDCVEGWVQGAEQEYKRLGFRIKQYHRVTPEEGAEFCSYRFYLDGRVERLNIEKTLFRILCSKPRDELLAQFAFECRHSPLGKEAMDFVCRCGWLPISHA